VSSTPEVSTVVVEPAPPTAPEAAAARAASAADVSAATGLTWQLAADADADLAGPDGAFWLARRAGDDGVLSCVGARAVALYDGPAVEVERLRVSLAARGLGLGTRGELEVATRLYRRTGWVEAAPYDHDADARLWSSELLG